MEALRKPAPLSFEGNVAENWRTFESEFDIFVEAAYSDKNDRTRTFILLNLAGKDAIEKAKTFTYAAEVRNEDGDIIQAAESQESVAVLKAKFRELCNPLTNVIIERHKFNTRFQEASEPVQNFITALKILADTCEFWTLKDSLIRNRIVCGLCKSSCLKKETGLSTMLFNSARFMKMLKGTARKSQINRKLMQSDNRPALPQSVTKHACTVDVVMYRRRNSARHLARSVLRA